MMNTANCETDTPDLLATFRNCIAAFDLIYLANHQDYQSRTKILTLKVEKCRLYVWGETLGWVSDANPLGTINDSSSNKSIRNVLNTITQFFSNRNWLSQVYGCRECLEIPANTHDSTIEVKHLESAFDNFKLRRDTGRILAGYYTPRQKWAIQDCKKFTHLLSEISNAVSHLRHISEPFASSALQMELMCNRIRRIDDPATLDLISKVCSESHPDISEISSQKLHHLSQESDYRWRIEHWNYISTVVPHSEVEIEQVQDSAEQTSWPNDQHMDFPMQDNRLLNEVSEQQSVTDDERGSEPGDTDWRTAKPLVIPINIMADTHSTANSAEYSNFHTTIANDTGSLPGIQYPMGLILNDSEDEDTKYTSSEGSMTVMEDSSKSQMLATPESEIEPQKLPTSQGLVRDVITSEDAGDSLTNGFMDFAIFNNEGLTRNGDYFVLSFASNQQDLVKRMSTSLNHFHYINARYFARIVRTDSYTAFDLSSWPRELQILELVDATLVDQAWTHAMRESKFQVNMFLIPTLTLPFCSGIDGGCLRTLFDVLAPQRLFARCTPSISVIDSITPDIYIVPVGKSTLVPRFISHSYPAFQPGSDVLLVLMVFTKQFLSTGSPKSGIWSVRRLLSN